MKYIIYAIIGTICFFIGVIGLEILIYKKDVYKRQAYPYRCNTTYGGCDNVSGEVKADTFRRSGLYSLQ